MPDTAQHSTPLGPWAKVWEILLAHAHGPETTKDCLTTIDRALGHSDLLAACEALAAWADEPLAVPISPAGQLGRAITAARAAIAKSNQ